MIIASLASYAQEKPRVVEKYKKHVRRGNLLTSWYFKIRGSSTVLKEELILYSNSTYRYVYDGGECGTFDTDESGTWKMSEDLLVLNGGRSFKIINNKLYYPDTYINEETWAMKRIK